MALDVIRGAIVRTTIVIIGTLLAQSLAAAATQLTHLGPEGGYIKDVEFHRTDPNVVYLAAASGFHRSTDGGASWQLTKGEFVGASVLQDIAVDPLNSERVYGAADEELVISTDGGRTFTSAAPANRQGEFYRIECGNDGVVYAVDGSTLYRSRDRGLTWEVRGAYQQPYDRSIRALSLAVDPTDSNVVYVGTNSKGLRVSRDAGATWTTMTSLPSSNLRVVVDRSNPLNLWVSSFDNNSALYRTTNGGAAWVQMLSSFVSGFAVDPLDPLVAYATSQIGTVVRTRDGGAHWDTLQRRLGRGPRQGFTVHPTQAGRLIGYSNGIWLSSDAGAQWTRGNTGVIADNVYRIVSAPNTKRPYIASRFSGVYRLDDQNRPQPTGNEALAALPPTFDNSVGDFAVIGGGDSPDTLLGVHGLGQVVRSTDSGMTWTVVGQTGTAATYTLVVTPGAQPTVFVGTLGGIMGSSDLGATWTPRGSGTPGHYIDLMAVSSNPLVLYAAPSGGGTVYRTTDGGQAWTASTILPGTIHSLTVHPTNEQTVYAGVDNALLKSTDGGTTWVKVSAAAHQLEFRSIAVDPRDAGVTYAAASGNVLRSIDGGVNWETLYASRNAHSYATTVLADPLKPNTLLVGTESMGLVQLTIVADNVPAPPGGGGSGGGGTSAGGSSGGGGGGGAFSLLMLLALAGVRRLH